MIPLFIASFLFGAKRLLRFLRYLQQDDYHPYRFLQWVWQAKAFDKRGSPAALLSYFLPILEIPAALYLAALALFENDPRKSGKIPLKMTRRAAKIYGISLALYGVLLAATLPFPSRWVLQIPLFQAVPLVLALGALLQEQLEKRGQKRYLEEAQAVLREVNPFVIGITGSYGKTSTKEALGEILPIVLGSTFRPPKGTNTPMGITRAIRENLASGHRYAVIEMAAYGKGSIERLCRLTPPQAGILTAVGPTHLERFGSIETIRRTKGELAENLPEGAFLAANGDDLRVREIVKENPHILPLFYGFDPKKGELACAISSYRLDPEKTTYTFHWRGSSYSGTLKTPGKHALLNAAGVFTLACALGAQPRFVVAALAQVEPVANRLHCTHDGKATTFHDAYNSNPEGFSSALDTLAGFPAKRKILMTPGIIELGPIQAEENEKIGRKAASICDIGLIVNAVNRDPLQKGLRAGGMAPENIHLCATRSEAFALLASLKQEEDAVLIENDLGDLYETVERF